MSHARLNAPDIKLKKTITSKQISLIREDNVASVLGQLRDSVIELQFAVKELQNRQIVSRAVNSEGLPLHGELCELLNGQFLEITQEAAAPNRLTISHGLGRIPQFCIIVKSPTFLEPLIEGDVANGIPAATDENVSFKLNGSIGDISYVILA